MASTEELKSMQRLSKKYPTEYFLRIQAKLSKSLEGLDLEAGPREFGIQLTKLAKWGWVSPRYLAFDEVEEIADSCTNKIAAKLDNAIKLRGPNKEGKNGKGEVD